MTGPDEGDDPTGAAGLERRYRRLLGGYPRRFRAERGEEMLAVLMASAADGQRRPRLKETANVITSAGDAHAGGQVLGAEPGLGGRAGHVQPGGSAVLAGHRRA